MNAKISRWLERMPDQTHQIILRAGDSRADETIIEKWILPIDDYADVVDVVADVMESEIQGRLIAYDGKSKQLRSLSVRSTTQTTNQPTETGMLVEGILRMAEEQRRFVATITDSFQTMHETIQDAIFVEREHHEEMADAQLAIAMSQMEHEQNQTSTTDKALQMFADVLNSRKNIDLKKTILENPNLIDSFLDDEEIVNLVMAKFSQK
jgi:hypothetical protein